MGKGYKGYILLLSACAVLISGCSGQEVRQQSLELSYAQEESMEIPAIDTDELADETNTVSRKELEQHPLFRVDMLSEEQIQGMTGVTWTENAPVSLEELRSVAVTYHGFDDDIYVGRIIIHEALAEDIRDIFQELYAAEFLIEKITPIYYYDGDDDASMEANNTSAFNFRQMTGSSSISVHGYGRAIDINPMINPYVKETVVLPESGEDYLNRADDIKGMITRGDRVYEAFTSRGWTWGGDWRTLKDYQHFEKKE